MKSFKAYLLESAERLAFLKKQHTNIDMSHDAYGKRLFDGHAHYAGPNGPTHSERLVDHFAAHADPSHNHKYTDWIVRQYKNKEFRLEDSPRIKSNLQSFEKLKGKLPHSDLNKYTHNELTGHLQTIRDAQHEHNKQFPDGPRFEGHKGATLVHDDGKGTTIHQLDTHAAGRAARASCGHEDETGGWCFGWKKPDYFEDYSTEGKIHLIQTPDNKKHAIHFPSEQLMDKDDRAVSVHHLIQKYPQLKEAKFGETHSEHHNNDDDLPPAGYGMQMAFKHDHEMAHHIEVMAHYGSPGIVNHHIDFDLHHFTPKATDAVIRRSLDHDHDYGRISPGQATQLPHFNSKHAGWMAEHGDSKAIKALIDHRSETITPTHTDTIVRRALHGGEDSGFDHQATRLPHLTQEHINDLWDLHKKKIKVVSHGYNKLSGTSHAHLVAVTNNPAHEKEWEETFHKKPMKNFR